MKLVEEFREFALRGSVIDLAVGVVIGAAFGRVVSSVVDHVIMPPVGLIIGNVDFPTWRLVLRSAAEGRPEVAIHIGMLLNALVQFCLVALAIFAVVRLMNHAMKREMKKAPPPTPEAELLREIRDLLKARGEGTGPSA